MIDLQMAATPGGHRLSTGPDAPGTDPCGYRGPAFLAKRFVDGLPASEGMA
jgi:hypothetical protein